MSDPLRTDEHQFKNFHRMLCERFGYGHDEKDWQRDQVSLIEHIVGQVAPPPASSLEDWVGCDLENSNGFDVMRAYNGIVVRPRVDYSRDTAVSNVSQMLVFQNPAHFVDWLTHWLETTKSTRSTR